MKPVFWGWGLSVWPLLAVVLDGGVLGGRGLGEALGELVADLLQDAHDLAAAKFLYSLAARLALLNPPPDIARRILYSHDNTDDN